MSLSYVDARDVLARSQFTEDSATAPEGEPFEIPQAPIFVMPEARQTQQHGNNTQRPSREKRPFRRVTKVNVWTSRTCSSNTGTTSRREWYPPAIGIRLARTRDLLTLLRSGKSVMPRGHYRRRSRVEPFQRLIARCLNKRTTISTRRDDVCVRVEQARGRCFVTMGGTGSASRRLRRSTRRGWATVSSSVGRRTTPSSRLPTSGR